MEGINNAIVIDLVDSYGQVYLAAYVDKQTFSSVDLEVEAIKNSLEESLPAYMIPLHIIIMDKLPLNVNGKIDRKSTSFT